MTVEQCLPLTVASFRSARIWEWPSDTTGTSSWTTSQGLSLGKIEYAVQNDANGLAIYIRRQYARLDSEFRLLEESLIPITTTRPRLGGKRHWVKCPMVHDAQLCGRRVGRLYLPPNATVFGCRHCYNLTYQSAREHDQRKANLARDSKELLTSLRSANPKRFMRGLAAWSIRY